jgi:hypothetical protein
MVTVGLTFDRWNLVWREFLTRFAPRCAREDCARQRSFWKRLRGQSRVIILQGERYCLDQCLEHALTEALERMRSVPKRSATHRIPLGLLLLSRQQLTAEQLRQALAAQSAAGRGRIGEWLQRLGFVNDVQITAALARQWSCPVLQAQGLTPDVDRIPQLPVALLESFGMAPIDYVPSTATLLMAFSEGIDYTVLYAIEQMLGCHTEPCLVLPRVLRGSLAALSGRRLESEVVFDRVADAAECTRIIRSYSTRIDASEIRMAACRPHLWVRLLGTLPTPLDLLLSPPNDASASLDLAAGHCSFDLKSTEWLPIKDDSRPGQFPASRPTGITGHE